MRSSSIRPPHVDSLLAQMSKPIPPLEARLHEGIRVDQPSRNILDDLKDLHVVVHSAYVRFTHLENRESDAEERLRPS